MSKLQKGLTLIELMIAMVLGLLVVGVVLTLFVTNVKSATENTRMVQLNQQLRAAMTFISNDLKRNGFSADPTNNVFMTTLNWDASSNCLRYSYDTNADGLQTNDELFGFRLVDSTIQWADGVTTNNCTTGNWQPLTEIEIAPITNFMVTTPSVALASGGVEIEQYIVTITGQINLNPGTATRTLRETIRIRNDNAS